MPADVPAVLSPEELARLAESRFTPGPWEAAELQGDENRTAVARVQDSDKDVFPVQRFEAAFMADRIEPDERLIAAAPDLLASAIHYAQDHREIVAYAAEIAGRLNAAVAAAQEADQLASIGRAASVEVERLWSDETIHQAGLALAEEVGEVGRAITKRGHAQRNGTCKGMTADEWTDNLRTELAQTVVVAARIAWAEGFDLATACQEQIDALRGRTDG